MSVLFPIYLVLISYTVKMCSLEFCHLYLLRIHNIDGEVESPQHHVAVPIAVVRSPLRGGGGVAGAGSPFSPACRHASAPGA